MEQALYRTGLLKICIFLCVCFAELNMVGANDQIEVILHDQLLRAKTELTRNLIFNSRKKRDSKSLNVSWNSTWVEAIENSNAVTVEQKNSNKNTTNSVFIISGEVLQTLGGEEISTFRLVPVGMLHDSQQILFVKSIEWENILFILLGLKNDHCHLYTASSEMDFALRQRISNTGNPVDAEFFIQHDQLFLIIIFNKHYAEEAPSLIFQWRSTHFDEENRYIITTGAVSVISFNHRDSVIIVIGQNTNGKQQISSQVWERKKNGALVKIQFLPTHRPVSIKHFVVKNQNFLLVLEETDKSSVYWWEGEEFVVWLPLPEIKGHYSVSFGYIKNETLIVLSKEDTVQIYCLLWNEFQLRGHTKFNGTIISLALHEGNKTLLVAAVKDTQGLKLHVTALHIEFYSEVQDVTVANAENDPLTSCMKQLEFNIDLANGQLRNIQNTLPKLLYTNKHEVIRDVSIRGGMHQVKIVRGKCSTCLLPGNEHIINKNEILLHKGNNMLNKTKHYINSIPHKLTGNETVILKNNLFIKEAKINSVNVKAINNMPADNTLNHNMYISLSGNQTIHTAVRVKSIKVNWLLASSIQDKITDNFILKNGTIHGLTTAAYLKCDNIQLVGDTTINNVNISDLARTHNNSIIKGKIHVNSAITEDLQVRYINKVNASELLERIKSKSRIEGRTNLKLQNNSVINNLYVNEINSVSVNDFFKNLFINNSRNTVKGNMHFMKQGVAAQNLEATVVNELIVSDMFTLTTEQHVRSRLAGAKISIASREKHLKTGSGTDTKSPIKKRETSKNIRKYKKIINKVKIEGNLQAKEIIFVNSNVTIMNQTVPVSSLETVFWTHSSDQTINVPVVIYGKTGVSGNLDVQTINGNNLSSLVECSQPHHIHTNLVLKNITVNGNITINRLINNSIDFKELENSAVKKMGKQTISGNKVFLGKLNVDHLTVGEINNVSADNLILNETTGDMIMNQWLHLTVGNMTIIKDLNPGTVNGYNLKNKMDSTVFKSDMNFKNINFTNVSVSSLSVEKLNNTDINGLSYTFESMKENLYYKEVHLKGSLSVDAINGVENINGIQLEKILPLVVNGSKDTVIRGKKTFASQVIIEGQVNISTLNKMSMQDLYAKTLSKTGDQIISDHYSFNHCSIKKLDTKFIDGLNTDHLLYSSQPVIEINSNLNISKFTLKGNIKSSKLLNNCYLPKMEENMLTWRKPEKWSAIHIDGNATWNKNSTGEIQNLFKSAARKNGKQVISGNVVFTNDITLENVQTQQFINGANMSHIMEDALMLNKRGQIISGIKIFEDIVFCENISITKNAAFKEVNSLNLNNLYKKLIFNSKDHNVTGQKTFINGFKAFTLYSQGGINGITSKMLVTPDAIQLLPDTVFENLVVTKSLRAEYINSINLDELLKQRIKLKSDVPKPQVINGTIVFKENVLVHGDMYAKQINDIKPDEIVYRDTNSVIRKTQNITGCKLFMEQTHIKGEIVIEKLNGKDIKAAYESSWLKYNNATINGNIVFEKEVTIDTVFGESYYIADRQVNHRFNISGKS